MADLVGDDHDRACAPIDRLGQTGSLGRKVVVGKKVIAQPHSGAIYDGDLLRPKPIQSVCRIQRWFHRGPTCAAHFFVAIDFGAHLVVKGLSCGDVSLWQSRGNHQRLGKDGFP